MIGSKINLKIRNKIAFKPKLKIKINFDHLNKK